MRKNFNKYNFTSLILLIILVLFGLVYGYKKNIKWGKGIITWENFTLVNSLGNEFDADILTSIEFKNSFESHDFEIFAYMDQNNSHREKDSVNDQLLIHEKYHFDITEYFARLVRKEIIGIGKENMNEYKLKKSIKKYLAQCDKMQDEYDTQSDHNREEEKQRFWELKIDDLLRQTETYKDSKLSNYHLYNQEKTTYFKKITLLFNNEMLKSYPVNVMNKSLGDLYQLLEYKDSSIVKYFKNGKNINGGYFNTAIFKLIKKTSNTFEKHYLDSNRTYNRNLKHQIERSIKRANNDLFVQYYNGNDELIKNDCLWEYSKENIFLGGFYNQNGESVSDENGVFKIRKTLDSLGRLIKEEYLGENGKLTLNNKSLISGSKNIYDENHCLKQKTLFNHFGVVAEHVNSFNLLYEYDDFGNISKITTLNPDNENTENNEGVCIYKYWYDLYGNRIQTKKYNKNGLQVLGVDDFFMAVKDFDSKNRISFKAKYFFLNTLKFDEDDKWGATKYEYIGDSIELRHNLDAYNNHFNDDTGVATVKILSSKDGFTSKMQYLDSKGNFAKTEDNIVQYLNTYDKNGNTIKETTLDSLGRKIPFSEDVSTVKWEYNKNNIKTKTTYYTSNGELANAKQNGTYNIFSVNDKNEISEVKYLDKKMNPVEIDGIFKTKYIVNRFGKDSIIKYYNKKNKLVKGVSIIKYKYNNFGSLIEESYFNARGESTRDESGISYKRYLLNRKQQELGYKYYNENFYRANNNQGYHYEKISINDYGYLMGYEYFNKKGEPIMNSDGYHKVIYERDSLGELLNFKTQDTFDNLVEDKDGIAEFVYIRGKSGLISGIKNYDKNGNLTNDEDGVAESYYSSSLNGLFYLEKEIDENGKEIIEESKTE